MEKEIIDDTNSSKEQEKDEKIKVKRKDVAQRNDNNKNYDFLPVKTTLNSFTKQEYQKIFYPVLEDILLDTNKACLEAHLFANYYYIRIMEYYDQIKDINIILKPDQDFYYKCLSIVSKGSYQRTEIKDKYLNIISKEYISMKPVDLIPANSSFISEGIFQNISLQMKIETSNYFEMEFLDKFKAYLSHKFKLDYFEVNKYITDIPLSNRENINVLPYIEFLQKNTIKIDKNISM